MKILWDAGTPLVASDIVKAESSMNINTVQASLRVLLKENLIEIADIVYSGTVLSRSYCIFREICASVPEERSAIPLETEQRSVG